MKALHLDGEEWNRDASAVQHMGEGLFTSGCGEVEPLDKFLRQTDI